jgi:hypothetical protein
VIKRALNRRYDRPFVLGKAVSTVCLTGISGWARRAVSPVAVGFQGAAVESRGRIGAQEAVEDLVAPRAAAPAGAAQDAFAAEPGSLQGFLLGDVAGLGRGLDPVEGVVCANRWPTSSRCAWVPCPRPRARGNSAMPSTQRWEAGAVWRRGQLTAPSTSSPQATTKVPPSALIRPLSSQPR